MELPQQLSMVKSARVLAALMVAIVAGACGGGGGGSPALTLGSLSFTTTENVALPGQLTATDSGGGTVRFAATGKPASGTLTNFTSSGAFTYTPAANFVGSDSFPVQATDAQGNMASGTVSITVQANQTPTASNVILRADGAALSRINVLANARDADGDPLTVTIAQAPLVGTASVNSDKSIDISGLPSGFKGLTRFKFQVADPSGATAVATAAIFVGADPFRAVFAGDASGNGSPEVYLTDFAADPKAVTTATHGSFRLSGFAVSGNGATIAYRSQDSSNSASSELAFVQTANPSQQTTIQLPAGLGLVQDAQGRDQFRVSPDGHWIALIAGQGSSNALYVLNLTKPATLSRVLPAGAVYVTQPAFASDSNSVYFLATSVAGGANKSLYFVALADPGTTALISAPSAPGSSDDVLQYSVARDQTRILEEANRQGSVGLYYIDPQHLQAEVQLNPTLLPGQSIAQSPFNSPPGIAVSAAGDRVAYTLQSLLLGVSTYVADVGATPNPQVVYSNTRAVNFRPDGAALLYSSGAQVYEATLGSSSGSQPVGEGGPAWYDSTGNIVLLEQFVASGGTPPSYPALAATVRGSFGTTQPLGTPVLAAQYFNVSGFDRAVVLLGEGPTTGPAAASAQLALVNALAGDKLLYLASFQSPLKLSTDIAQVVTY